MNSASFESRSLIKFEKLVKISASKFSESPSDELGEETYNEGVVVVVVVVVSGGGDLDVVWMSYSSADDP